MKLLFKIIKIYLLIGVISVLTLKGCATEMLLESASKEYSIFKPIQKIDHAFINEKGLALEFKSNDYIWPNSNLRKCITITNDQCQLNYTIKYEYLNKDTLLDSKNPIESSYYEQESLSESSKNEIWKNIAIHYIDVDDEMIKLNLIKNKSRNGIFIKINTLIDSGYFSNLLTNNTKNESLLIFSKTQSKSKYLVSSYYSGITVGGLLITKIDNEYFYYLINLDNIRKEYIRKESLNNKYKYLGLPFAFALDVITFPISIVMYNGLRNIGN